VSEYIRYAIEPVMSTSAPYGVWDSKLELYACQCETEAKALLIIEALITLEELNKGYYT